MKGVLLIELNEFNRELLEEAAQTLDVPHIQSVLSWPALNTRSADGPESPALEPWTQWVSIHTGLPTREHGVTELGAAPHLRHRQLWERVGDDGITSGVWGAMNATRRAHPAVRFFVPDPWAFGEPCHPAGLESFLAPARAMAKRTGAAGDPSGVGALIAFASALRNLGLWGPLWRMMPFAASGLLRDGPRALTFYAPYEHLATHAFSRLVRQEQPTLAIVFLNMLAHAQHYYWEDWNRGRRGPLVACLHWLDRSLGVLLDASGSRNVVVYGALSQKPTATEAPWVMYQHRSHETLLSLAASRHSHIEPLMTHDAHLFYRNTADADEARGTLAAARVAGKPLFEVQRFAPDATRLVYRLAFTDEVDEQTTFTIKGRTHRFADHFVRVVKRTGRHTPDATLFSQERLTDASTCASHEVSALLHRYVRTTP